MATKQNNRRRKARILEHAELHGLCTTASVARLFSRSSGWARRVLWQMARDGHLRRHTFRSSTGRRRIQYYSQRERPLKPAEFRRCFSILHFSEIRRPKHRLVTRGAFGALSQRMCTVARVPVQPYVACYMEQDPARKRQRLSLIRVAPAPVIKNLNHAMMDLQRYASGDPFRLWIYFARQNLMSITYLVPGNRFVNELARWLTRHPLVAQVGPLQAAVPVIVVGSVYL